MTKDSNPKPAALKVVGHSVTRVGIPFAKVHATFADTDKTPFAHSTSGSTTTFTSGLAAEQAAGDARQRLLEAAAKVLETDPDNVIWQDDFVRAADATDFKIPVTQIIRRQFDSFKIPNLLDTPPIETILVEEPDPCGPFGAKALGEPPLVPVAAAIVNAVYDATGVRIRELPITAEKVLRGLQSRR